MKRKIDTTVQYSGLKPGRYDYAYHLDDDFFSEFENEELGEGNVDFAVRLERKERMLIFNFSFHGTLMSVCDRCLGKIEVPVEGKETLCVKFSDTEESDSEDVVILPESEYQIDLAQWMYEYVVVAMPMQKIHPEGMCDPEMEKYIVAEAEEGEGQEAGEKPTDEIDPRWEALLKLK